MTNALYEQGKNELDNGHNQELSSKIKQKDVTVEQEVHLTENSSN